MTTTTWAAVAVGAAAGGIGAVIGDVLWASLILGALAGALVSIAPDG